jgi:hypothetical protein
MPAEAAPGTGLREDRWESWQVSEELTITELLSLHQGQIRAKLAALVRGIRTEVRYESGAFSWWSQHAASRLN